MDFGYCLSRPRAIRMRIIEQPLLPLDTAPGKYRLRHDSSHESDTALEQFKGRKRSGLSSTRYDLVTW